MKILSSILFFFIVINFNYSQTNISVGEYSVTFTLPSGIQRVAYDCFNFYEFNSLVQVTDRNGLFVRLDPVDYGFISTTAFINYLDTVKDVICISGPDYSYLPDSVHVGKLLLGNSPNTMTWTRGIRHLKWDQRYSHGTGTNYWVGPDTSYGMQIYSNSSTWGSADDPDAGGNSRYRRGLIMKSGETITDFTINWRSSSNSDLDSVIITLFQYDHDFSSGPIGSGETYIEILRDTIGHPSLALQMQHYSFIDINYTMPFDSDLLFAVKPLDVPTGGTRYSYVQGLIRIETDQ